MNPYRFSKYAFVILMLSVVLAAYALQAPSFPSANPMEFTAGRTRIRVVPIATGLIHPWSLAFLPDGRLLVAEQPGRLRVIQNGVLDPQPVWTAPGFTPSSDLMRAVEVHPQFAQNHLVYFSYPKAGPRGFTLAVSRGKLEGSTLTDVSEIFVADAWETSAALGLGGRIMFGPDSMLYIAVGDRDLLYGTNDNSGRMRAQALDTHIGKVLRIRDDGSIPKDNPFVGRAGAKPEIYTYGHRNTYGFAFHPTTGELWQAEIGPMGGDEVNILSPGKNYGWPLVSMGRNYTGTLVSDQPWARPGMENPRLFWVPSISPSSILFYTGDKFPAWKGSLFVGALNGSALIRVGFNQPSQAEPRESLLNQLGTRFRDVRQGPEGFIYVATEQGIGGSAANGTVLRIEPVN